MKSLFQSKTIAVATVTSVAGVVATFIPSVGEFITANAAGILVTLGAVNFVLRLVTKDKVALFPES